MLFRYIDFFLFFKRQGIAMPHSKLAVWIAACVLCVFMVLIFSRVGKNKITVEIHDHQGGKTVKKELSDETCRSAFSYWDRYIEFLKRNKKISKEDIQAIQNRRDIIWISWKFPEKLSLSVYAEKLNHRAGEKVRQETVLMQCMDIFEHYQGKIEAMEKMNPEDISREKIDKIFHLSRMIANYRDDQLSREHKELLGRP